MLFPTVTETRLALEPCTADTFIADLEPRRGGRSATAPASGSTNQEHTR